MLWFHISLTLLAFPSSFHSLLFLIGLAYLQKLHENAKKRKKKKKPAKKKKKLLFGSAFQNAVYYITMTEIIIRMKLFSHYDEHNENDKWIQIKSTQNKLLRFLIPLSLLYMALFHNIITLFEIKSSLLIKESVTYTLYMCTIISPSQDTFPCHGTVPSSST